MNDGLMTAAEAAEVDAYINSPDNRRWESEFLATVRKARGLPTQQERYQAELKRRLTVRKNAVGAKRHAAKLRRTPIWADQQAIQSIYAEARRLTETTGTPHHVDHVVPLQGRLVSGLHVENNLQVLTGSENSKKRNHFEVE